jgi:hypothetical protein
MNLTFYVTTICPAMLLLSGYKQCIQRLYAGVKDYLFGSEINSEGKINIKINRKIKSTSEFCKIIKGIIWNRDIPKQYRTTIYQIYFKLIVTFNARMWTVTKRNKSKTQAMDMKFLRSVKGNTRWDRIHL